MSRVTFELVQNWRRPTVGALAVCLPESLILSVEESDCRMCTGKEALIKVASAGTQAVELSRRLRRMVTITFPDRETEKRALAFLIGRFSGRVLRSGEHLVPEAALEALADQNIPFSVKGKTSYEQQMAAIRGVTSPSV